MEVFTTQKKPFIALIGGMAGMKKISKGNWCYFLEDSSNWKKTRVIYNSSGY